MTTEECLVISGHCFDQLNIIDTELPKYIYRRCKHCNFMQRLKWDPPKVGIEYPWKWEAI